MPTPLLLAGPILRRVEKKQASVWMAFSQSISEVKLEIWEEFNLKFNDAKPADLFVSGQAASVQIGKNLHIALVTAAFAEDKTGFNPTKIYSYNVSFGAGKNLNSEGLLKGADVDGRKQLPLGYKDNVLPSFALPGDTPEKLIIAQGSCRKMHGHGDDALAFLDKAIEDNFTVPEKRIQQLFLTGDQIYADDVPAVLLKYANNTGGQTLVSAEEKVRIQRESGTVKTLNGSALNFPCLLRQQIVQEYAGFTSSDADCHLITFGEFCATYLNYWNVRAWNSGFYDKMKTLSADITTLEAVATSIWDAPSTASDPTILNAIETAKQGTDSEFAFPQSLLDTLTDSAKKLEWRKEQREKIKDELREVVAFFNALPTVSRVLANVPTYMMLDDHEITDDWNITKYWRNEVFSKPLGRDIIRNGLMAFTIFQDWGNSPEDYGAGKPKKALLDSIVKFGTDLANDQNPTDSFRESLEKMLGLGADPGPKWHYSVPSGPAQTLVLNTRTAREHLTLNAPPGLLTEAALKDQVPERPEVAPPFIFVLSPVPAVGLASFEELIQPGAAAGIGTAKKKGAVAGGFEFDVEAWGFNPTALQRLFARLVPYGKVIFLSGDVHYGHSSVLDYWKSGSTAPDARFIQLTSSALKNAWLSNLFFFRSGFVQRIFGGFGGAKLEKIGWQDKLLTTNGYVTARNRARMRKSTAIVPVEGWTPGATVNQTPDFKWRMQFAAHEGKMDGDPFNDLDLGLDDAELYKKTVVRHQDAFNKGFARRLAWPSNVSLVQFEGSGSSMKVKHTFLFKRGSAGDMVHEFALTASGADATAPAFP